MSKHLTREIVAEQAVVRTSVREPVRVDRTFEMPKSLYAATVGCYLAFIGIMALGFPSPGLVIPMAIFAFIIVMGFAVPTVWNRLKPGHASKSLNLDRLFQRGIVTHTGLLSGKDAAAQMLILPALIVMWGLTAVVIAGMVSAG